MILRRAAPFFFLLAVLGLAGCGVAPATGSPFDQRGSAGASRLTIQVENQNYNDVRLYAESIRGRRSLGIVTGNTKETFRIDWPNQDELRIRMEFLAGQTVASNRVTVGPGDEVELFITAVIRNSTLRRR